MSDSEEFWWLSNAIDWQELAVEIGHHSPLREEHVRPANFGWKPSKARDLVAWRSLHGNANVYRKLIVVSSTAGAFLGPIMLDIDHERVTYDQNDHIIEIDNDLNEARRVALIVWQRLEAAGIAHQDVRTYFSGRKGFHFEIRPSAIGCRGTLQEQINSAGFWERDFLETIPDVEPCHIDRSFLPRLRTCDLRDSHSSVRLADSMNCWFDLAERLVCRRKLRMTHADLVTSSAEEICERAERAEVESG